MSGAISNQPVLAIIGPSGSGKSTILHRLVEDGLLHINPTWTDRPPRHDEPEVEHVFVSPKELDDLAAKGFFVHEPTSLFGLPYRYAMPKVNFDSTAIPTVMMRSSVLKLLTHYYPNTIIYQIEARKDLVESNLKNRVATGDSLGSRFKDYSAEIKAGRQIANKVFVNQNLDQTITHIKRALMSDFHIA